MMRLLPIIHTESAFTSHKTIEHELVLVCNPLQVLPFRTCVETENLFRRLSNGCLDWWFIVTLHDSTHAFEELAIVSFNFHVSIIRHLILPTECSCGGGTTRFYLSWWSLHDWMDHISLATVLLLHETFFNKATHYGYFCIHYEIKAF